MKLGMHGPRPWPHCFRWGPIFLSPKGGGTPSIFGPYLLWPNGWMDQDATWYEGRTPPRRLCVRWGPSSSLPKTAAEPPPQFSAYVHCGQTDGWIKMALGMEVGLGLGHIVLHGEPAPSPPKGGGAPPQFSAHFYCVQTAGCHLIWRPQPGDFVIDGDPTLLPKKGAEPPNFRPMCIAAKRLDASRCHLVWR